MTESTKSNSVECRDCEKVIGIFKGEGVVIGMCIGCYEALH